MTWVKLDDGFTEHPKIVRAGKTAAMLLIDSIMYSARQLTDGYVTSTVLVRWGYGRSLRAAITSLVEVGLWAEVEGGYQIHDYLDSQQSGASVKAEREAAKERMRRFRSASVRANNTVRSPEVRQLDVDKIESKSKNLLDEDVERTREKKTTTKFPWTDWDAIPIGVREELAQAFPEITKHGHMISNHVNDALNHTARLKAMNTVTYLKGWLRRDVERLEASHAINGRSVGGSQDSGRSRASVRATEPGSRGPGAFAGYK